MAAKHFEHSEEPDERDRAASQPGASRQWWQQPANHRQCPQSRSTILKAQSQFQFQLNTNLSMKDVAPGIKIRETGGLASIMVLPTTQHRRSSPLMLQKSTCISHVFKDKHDSCS